MKWFLLTATAATWRSTATACNYSAHSTTIGPHAEQERHDIFECSSADACPTEAAAACDKAADCNSFGLNPEWKDGAAQLYVSTVPRIRMGAPCVDGAAALHNRAAHPRPVTPFLRVVPMRV